MTKSVAAAAGSAAAIVRLGPRLATTSVGAAFRGAPTFSVARTPCNYLERVVYGKLMEIAEYAQSM